MTIPSLNKKTLGVLLTGFLAVWGGVSGLQAESNGLNSAKIEFIDVPGGTFVMGSERPGDEFPPREVTVGAFRLSKMEITEEQFKVTAQGTDFRFESLPGASHLPAENMSWETAVQYCNFLSLADGLQPAYHIQGWLELLSGDPRVPLDTSKVERIPGANGYRLPTEAEWEFAARGGLSAKGGIYIGGDNPETLAWYEANTGEKPHEVGTKAPNELGLRDMAGNVAEWVWDNYGPYPKTHQTDPQGPAWGPGHVVRGGGWFGAGTDNLRSSFRTLSVEPGSNIGFRLVLPPR
jgi:formylglycine-generating enzyme required for sulfatase activity